MHAPWYAIAGPIVKEKRLARKLSGNTFSEMVDITPGHLRHFESGRAGLSVEVLVKIASALDLSLDEMLLPLNDEQLVTVYARALTKLNGGPKHMQFILRMLRSAISIAEDMGMLDSYE